MSEQALIGPNAILQMLPVLEETGGPALVDRIVAAAGLFNLPDGSSMIPEGEAGALHQALRRVCPSQAPDLAAQAGERTARYILAHRIPKPAQHILKALPAPLAARSLARAIGKHAWTFAGSGRFEVETPWRFKIHANPIVRGEASQHPLCHWHSAVFAKLYQSLVAPDCTCRETSCCAQPGQTACTFELTR